MGCMATLDPPLDVLRRQVVAASEIELSEIGWIAGADHRQEGPHFPEYPAPAGNPPYEVDAIDVPHAPSRGADMSVMTEALRLSRDPRIKLVIFNRRIFSSYDHSEGDPYTWRPYREENPHTGHAHIERTDSLRTDLRPWSIGIDNGGLTMFLAACKVGDSGPHVAFLQYALWALHEESKADGAAPLWPLKDNVPQIPAKMDTVAGQAMRRLLDGGDGIHFTPLLATRLIRKLGKVDVELIPGPPGAGVSADEAREIARDEISGATATLTPSA